MQLLSSSVRRLIVPAAQKVVRFRNMLAAPVHRPRITTRWLMVLVALVAVGMWAAINLPQAIDQVVYHRLRAVEQAGLERRLRGAERERLKLARAVETERDEWRRDTQSPHELTEHYFASRREFYILRCQLPA